MEEAEREEEEEGEEEEEESPKELETEEEEIAIAGGLGFSVLLALGGRSLTMKKSRFGVRLNSEKMGVGSVVSHSTRSQLQRHCIFLGGCNVF